MILKNLTKNVLILQSLKYRPDDRDIQIRPLQVVDLMAVFPDEKRLAGSLELRQLEKSGIVKLFPDVQAFEAAEAEAKAKRAAAAPVASSSMTQQLRTRAQARGQQPEPQTNAELEAATAKNVAMASIEDSTSISDLEDIIDDPNSTQDQVNAAIRRLSQMGVGGDNTIEAPELQDQPNNTVV